MSYFHQVCDVPFTAETIPGRFDVQAAKNPNKDAVVVYNLQGRRDSLTFKSLQDQSVNLAASLHDHGITSGDRVLAMLPNCLEYPVVIMALIRLGANIVFLCTGTSVEIVAIALKKYKIVGILVHAATGGAKCLDHLKATLGEDNKLKAAVCVGNYENDATGNGPIGVLSYEYLVENGRNIDTTTINELQNQIQPDDPVIVLLTSGSTGEPKAVQHTHFSLINSFNLSTSILYTREDSIMFNGRPMGWIGGFQCGLMFVFALGATLVSFSGLSLQPQINQICRLLEKEKCTHFQAVIFMIYDLVHYGKLAEHDLSHLKYIFTGGQPIPEVKVHALLKQVPHLAIFNLYGSTEAQVFVAHGIITASNLASNTAGILRPFPHYEMKIVDKKGRIVPLNAPGELCLRGPGLFYEYLQLDHTKAHLTKARWFHTGDGAVMFGNGLLRVLGRTGNAILKASETLYPADIEIVLNTHPSAKQVIVVGVPDERSFMEVCACFIMKPGHELDNEAMVVWCDSHFDTYNGVYSEKPKYFLCMETFPLTTTGKINRKRVQEMAVEQLGL